jgi:3-oxoacyl-[acyl-carrier-protein] synthase II
MDRNRVVITGLGAVTCLGSSIDLLWEGLISGRSGIRKLPNLIHPTFPVR